jgi:hypothetical protein
MEQINPIIEQKRKFSAAIGVISVFLGAIPAVFSHKRYEFYYLCILFSILFNLLAMAFKQFVTIILF